MEMLTFDCLKIALGNKHFELFLCPAVRPNIFVNTKSQRTTILISIEIFIILERDSKSIVTCSCTIQVFNVSDLQ